MREGSSNPEPGLARDEAVFDTPVRLEGGDLMRKLVSIVVVALITTLGLASSASAAPSPNASCNGAFVSSLAGQPGEVAAETREFHAIAKALGLPPGSFDAAGAHVHGTVEECLEALG